MKPYKSMVYVIEGPDSVKIGFSIEPEARCYGLAVRGKKKLRLVHATMPLKNARVVERTVHRKFERFALGGEWFSVPVVDACDAVEAVARETDPYYAAVPLPSVDDMWAWLREDKPCPFEYQKLIHAMATSSRRDWPERWRT